MKKYLPLAAMFLLAACNQTAETPAKDKANKDTSAPIAKELPAETAATQNNTTADILKPIEVSDEDLKVVDEKNEEFVAVESAKDVQFVPFEFTFKKAGDQTKGICKDTADFASLVKGQLVYTGIWSTCDVNEDGKTDYLLCVKGTKKEGFETDDMSGNTVDRNRRGFILAINKGDHFETDVRNLNCFLSENEDGGVYFAPELSVKAEGRKLDVNYGHGRYGSWGYSFLYNNGNYELVNCVRSENDGPVMEAKHELDLGSNTLKVKTLKDNANKDKATESDYQNKSYKVKQLRKVVITEIATIF